LSTPAPAGTVTLLFSVPFPEAVTRIRDDHALTDAVGGISVFQGLVDTQLVSWAHSRGLLVLAWTVNDGDRLNQLLRRVLTASRLRIWQSCARCRDHDHGRGSAPSRRSARSA
jgi:hypothetical protein